MSFTSPTARSFSWRWWILCILDFLWRLIWTKPQLDTSFGPYQKPFQRFLWCRGKKAERCLSDLRNVMAIHFLRKRNNIAQMFTVLNAGVCIRLGWIKTTAKSCWSSKILHSAQLNWDPLTHLIQQPNLNLSNIFRHIQHAYSRG